MRNPESQTHIHRGALSPWIPELKKTLTNDQREKLSSEGIVIRYQCPHTSEIKVSLTQHLSFLSQRSWMSFKFCSHMSSAFEWMTPLLRCGGPKLKGTQVYPRKFAERLYKLHSAYKAFPAWQRHCYLFMHTIYSLSLVGFTAFIVWDWGFGVS